MRPIFTYFVQEWKDIWLRAGRAGVDAAQAAFWISRRRPVAGPLDAVNARHRYQRIVSETIYQELSNGMLCARISGGGAVVAACSVTVSSNPRYYLPLSLVYYRRSQVNGR